MKHPAIVKQAIAFNGTKTGLSSHVPSRRDVLAGTAAIGATFAVGRERAWAADGKTTFTILHTNDLHSTFIGMAPATDYTPFTLNDDSTRGGLLVWRV